MVIIKGHNYSCYKKHTCIVSYIMNSRFNVGFDHFMKGYRWQKLKDRDYQGYYKALYNIL